MSLYHHNGHETVVRAEGEWPEGLLHGFGTTPAAALEDFWRNVRLEADLARERNADPDAPLTERMILALELEREDPIDHTA